jgi:hypothetical protein
MADLYQAKLRRRVGLARLLTACATVALVITAGLWLLSGWVRVSVGGCAGWSTFGFVLDEGYIEAARWVQPGQPARWGDLGATWWSHPWWMQHHPKDRLWGFGPYDYDRGLMGLRLAGAASNPPPPGAYCNLIEVPLWMPMLVWGLGTALAGGRWWRVRRILHAAGGFPVTTKLKREPEMTLDEELLARRPSYDGRPRPWQREKKSR